MILSVQKASPADAPVIAAMAQKIWHSSTHAELAEEFCRMAADPEAAVFQISDGNKPCGFAQCGLRRDYVEGSCSSPVGYLEGIYVEPEYRKHGCARMLLAACEEWARRLGCSEFASDCELDNADSLAFHLNVGFSEANRIICFLKKL